MANGAQIVNGKIAITHWRIVRWRQNLVAYAVALSDLKAFSLLLNTRDYKRGVVEYSDFGPIERYISETVQDRSYVIGNRI